MIVSDTYTINISLVFALALASVVNYARKWRHSLERHLLTTLVVIYDCNMFIVQAAKLEHLSLDTLTSQVLNLREG